MGSANTERPPPCPQRKTGALASLRIEICLVPTACQSFPWKTLISSSYWPSLPFCSRGHGDTWCPGNVPEAAELVRARVGTGPLPVWLLWLLPPSPHLPCLWGLLSCEMEVIQPQASGMDLVTSQTLPMCPSSTRVPSRSLTPGQGMGGPEEGVGKPYAQAPALQAGARGPGEEGEEKLGRGMLSMCVCQPPLWK